jgi:hypothetical protein
MSNSVDLIITAVLINRLFLYGSPRSRAPLDALLGTFNEYYFKVLGVIFPDAQKTLIPALLGSIGKSLAEFLKTVREEMGTDSIDKKIVKDIEKIGKANGVNNKGQKKNKPRYG